MADLEELEAYEGSHALAVECLLPPHWKNSSNIIQMWIVERLQPPPPNVIFYLMVRKIRDETANLMPVFTYQLYLGSSTKIIPEPDKFLSWQYGDNPIIAVKQVMPNLTWGLKLGMMVAAGITCGILPLSAQENEDIESRWQEVLESTANNWTGLNRHTGSDN